MRNTFPVYDPGVKITCLKIIYIVLISILFTGCTLPGPGASQGLVTATLEEEVSVDPTNTLQPAATATPTAEPPPTPDATIVELEGDFEGYSVFLDENGAAKFITDPDGNSIVPDPTIGVFRIDTKNNLYFWDGENKEMVESVVIDGDYVKYWDKNYYRIASTETGSIKTENLGKTLIGTVAYDDPEKPVAIILPGGASITPNYDGDFPIPNKPGWFYQWDKDTKKLKEANLGEILEFDRVDMDILGKNVPFVVGTDRSADIREPWDEIGIEELVFNPENENIKDSVVKMFTATMWMVSDAARGGITYEDFMSKVGDPTNTVKLPGIQDGFNLNQITRVNFIFRSTNPSSASTNNESMIEYSLLEDGTLTICRTVGKSEITGIINSFNANQKYFNKGGEQSLGSVISNFISRILQLRNDGTNDEFNNRIDEVFNICGDVRKIITTHSQYLLDVKKHGIWYANVNH